MSRTKGVVALFLVTTLAIPTLASAGWKHDEERGRYTEDCHGNKGKCHGEKGNHKAKDGYRAAGGPPPWAPAHGWRSKNQAEVERHDTRTDGYAVVERKETRVIEPVRTRTVDVGIQKGTCNRRVIGTVLGGIVGGVIGNQIGKENGNREVSTVLGAVVGGLVGNNIGSKMDKSDQKCTGQVLEQASDRQTVRWADATQKGEYRVTPLRTYQSDGRFCRDFVTEHKGLDGIQRQKSTACRNPDGVWQKVRM